MVKNGAVYGEKEKLKLNPNVLLYRQPGPLPADAVLLQTNYVGQRHYLPRA